jgi:hypothetical protein
MAASAAAIASIIAALIGGGTAIGSGVAQKRATERASEEAKALSEQAIAKSDRQAVLDRRYGLQALGQQNALAREQMNLSERMQTAQLAQSKASNMAARQQERYQRAIGILNSNQALKNRVRSLFGGAR